jgi:probable rRNA maturation factor
LVRGREEFERLSGDIESLGKACSGGRAVEVNLVGERRMAFLNRRYKGRRGAAEILTFVYEDDSVPGGEGTAGEILICWSRLVSSARSVGVSSRAYLLRLVAHGLCHIEGFSHGDEASADIMEERERELLGGFLTGEELGRLFEGDLYRS